MSERAEKVLVRAAGCLVSFGGTGLALWAGDTFVAVFFAFLAGAMTALMWVLWMMDNG